MFGTWVLPLGLELQAAEEASGFALLTLLAAGHAQTAGERPQPFALSHGRQAAGRIPRGPSEAVAIQMAVLPGGHLHSLIPSALASASKARFNCLGIVLLLTKANAVHQILKAQVAAQTVEPQVCLDVPRDFR